MRISIEKRIFMDCPEGFHELTDEEKKEMNFSPDEKIMAISDPARRIIIAVAWAQISPLNAFLLGRREISWNMSRQIEKKLKKFSFVWLADVKRDISGMLARGMDYEYVANRVHMSCESLVIKSEEDLYYFHMYASKVRRDESLEIFHEILDNVVISE